MRTLFRLPLLVILACSPVSAGPAWQRIAILPPEAAAAGVFPGGEGSQWPRWSIATSPAAPDFLLLPIDVGGVYRSLDGGGLWETAMGGWNARGANCFSIDPRDGRRALGVGGNSLNWNSDWGPSPHGLYLTTDQGSSWRQTLAVPDGLVGLVLHDPASYDETLGYCTVAYYSAPLSGLFRSDDGGATWKHVSSLAAEEVQAPGRAAAQYDGAALVAVHPSEGSLYLGGRTGLHRSDDRGHTFTRLHDMPVWGLSVSPAKPDSVWISGPDGILVSEDKGRTFAALPARGLDLPTGKPVRQVTVSPLRPERMFAWVAGDHWQWIRYVSHDAGASFRPVLIDAGLGGAPERLTQPNARPGGVAVLPYNVRNGHFAWHAADPDIAFGLGGDWVVRSTDGGLTFSWWNNGYAGIMLGRSFNFSAHAPDVVFLAFQDYNGAFTTDGGRTWHYRDISGLGWGGHAYGGHAVNERVMWYGDAEGWGTPRRLRISRDGGDTWTFARDESGEICRWSGADVSLSDPKNPDILFASDWRSTDQGLTWRKMPDCDGVFIATPSGRLVGRKLQALVVSDDSGATWRKIVDVPGGFVDAAHDHERDHYFVVSEERLKRVDAADGTVSVLQTPLDQYGKTRVESVAVDPLAPRVVYAGGPRNLYATHATVFRSTDGGDTWLNLTTPHGPHEVQALRVHPVTRELWVNGQCYGMWKLPPPYGTKTDAGETSRSAPAPR